MISVVSFYPSMEAGEENKEEKRSSILDSIGNRKGASIIRSLDKPSDANLSHIHLYPSSATAA